MFHSKKTAPIELIHADFDSIGTVFCYRVYGVVEFKRSWSLSCLKGNVSSPHSPGMNLLILKYLQC